MRSGLRTWERVDIILDCQMTGQFCCKLVCPKFLRRPSLRMTFSSSVRRLCVIGMKGAAKITWRGASESRRVGQATAIAVVDQS